MADNTFTYKPKPAASSHVLRGPISKNTFNSKTPPQKLPPLEYSFENMSPQETLRIIENRKNAEQEMYHLAKYRAEQILKVGVRFSVLEDDYDARFKELMESLDGQNPDYENQLITEILKQDEGAAHSWLTFKNIQKVQKSCSISSGQKQALAEGFAAAYNKNPKYLDKYVTPPEWSLYPKGRHEIQKWPEDIQKTTQILDWIQSSQGPEAKKFKENYSRNLLKKYVHSENADTHRRIAAAGLMLHLEDTDISPRPYGDTVKRIYSAAATTESKTGKETAVALIKIAAENLNLFYPDGANVPASRPIKDSAGRVAVLTELMTSQNKAILDELTTYNGSIVGTNGGEEFTHTDHNVEQLGTLFNLTLFENSEQSAALRAKVVEYSNDLKVQVNASVSKKYHEGWIKPSDQLEIISAATGVALTQNYKKLRDNIEMRKEFYGFAVDISLFAASKKAPLLTPVKSQIKGAIQNVISESLNKDDEIRNALEEIKDEELVDPETGLLSFEARKEIVDIFDQEVGDLAVETALVNVFREALLNGIEDGKDRKTIRNNANYLLEKYKVLNP